MPSASMRRAAAYHEAGHAVVALREGFVVATATIAESEDAGGYVGCISDRPLPDEPHVIGRGADRRRLCSAIRVALAGRIAQRKAAPRSYRSWHDAGDRRNASRYSDMLYARADPRAWPHLRRQHDRATAIVESLWPAIDALAQVLMAGRTIGVREVYRLWAANGGKHMPHHVLVRKLRCAGVVVSMAIDPEGISDGVRIVGRGTHRQQRAGKPRV